jgi:GYF domain 2
MDEMTEIRPRDATGADLRHYLYWTSHHGRHEWLLRGADRWLEQNPDATAVDLFRFLETDNILLDERTMRRAAKWLWGDSAEYVQPLLRPGQHVGHTVPEREIRRGFPPDAHLKGGRNAAPVLAAMAQEFYAPIIPIVLELHGQGLSLRAIARELDQRKIRTRIGCYYKSIWSKRPRIIRWSAAQVRRVLIRSANQAIQLWIDEATKGPFTKAQVKIMLDAQTVTRDTLFWRPGMAGARPLRELFGEAQQDALDADQ